MTTRSVPTGANKYFTSTLMIDGTGYGWKTSIESSPTQMPNYAGGNYSTGGNIGNGYVRITLKS